jgi:hypothetical protein
MIQKQVKNLNLNPKNFQLCYFLKKIFKEHEKLIFPEIETKLRSSED